MRIVDYVHRQKATIYLSMSVISTTRHTPSPLPPFARHMSAQRALDARPSALAWGAR